MRVSVKLGAKPAGKKGKRKRRKKSPHLMSLGKRLFHVGTVLFIPIATDIFFFGGRILPSWLFTALLISFVTLWVTGLIVYFLGGGDVDATGCYWIGSQG